MSWLRNICKGSSSTMSKGNHQKKTGDKNDGVCNETTNSQLLSGHESENQDHVIARTLSKEELKKRISTGTKFNAAENKQLAQALQERLIIKSPPPKSREMPRICAGCDNEIGRGKFLSLVGALWHPKCFNCYACGQPIVGDDFSKHEDHPYHMSCYRKCDVCKEFLPTTTNGKSICNKHPFWMQKSCPSHQDDGTHRCFSCHRLEKLKQPKISIFILKGLPRIVTGEHLAHEMMHAWLRLNGYPPYGKLDRYVEEGICIVMSYMWLEIELSGSDSNVASSSSSSSSASYRKGPRSQFERKLGEYCKYALENRVCPIYGDGFRAGHAAVLKYGLKNVLDHIKLTGKFPC